MLLVDDRAGSNDLVVPLQRLGLPAELSRLEYGDLAFVGRGEGKTTVDIGIEFKKLAELITSIRDGRFAGHQLPGMNLTYTHYWLLIEGAWKSNTKGEIIVPHRHGWHPIQTGMTASAFNKHILTFELCGGCHVHFTNTRVDTHRFICSLYRWWTDVAMDAHTSHLAVHTPVGLIPLSPFRQAICSWPGIGRKTSKAIETHFGGSITRAATATTDEWAGIVINSNGRRLGHATAEKLQRFLRGRQR
jgi:ERCC4-type nuclease